MTFYTKDYDLDEVHLMDKYEGYWEEHPGYPAADWRREVEERDTREGYWAWVRQSLENEQEELENDNPYNQPWSEA